MQNLHFVLVKVCSVHSAHVDCTCGFVYFVEVYFCRSVFVQKCISVFVLLCTVATCSLPCVHQLLPSVASPPPLMKPLLPLSAVAPYTSTSSSSSPCSCQNVIVIHEIISIVVIVIIISIIVKFMINLAHIIFFSVLWMLKCDNLAGQL